jgi:hypothetical protein
MDIKQDATGRGFRGATPPSPTKTAPARRRISAESLLTNSAESDKITRVGEEADMTCKLIPDAMVRARGAAPILVVTTDATGRRSRFWMQNRGRALRLLDRLVRAGQRPEIVRG